MCSSDLTATYAMSNAMLPFLRDIANLSIQKALQMNKTLARGVYTHNGGCTKIHLAEGFGLPFVQLESSLEV